MGNELNFREKLQIEMVQPTGPKHQQEAIQRGGGGEAAFGAPGLRQQVGLHSQILPWKDRQRRQEPLPRRHGPKEARATLLRRHH